MKLHLIVAAALLGTMSFAQAEKKLVIKGSDTLGAKMVPQLKEAYNEKHPDVVFEIAAEGSSQGVAAIIDGTADIGMSSRGAKSTEIEKAKAEGRNMTPTTVAFDGIAVIVNEANPMDDVTLEQIESVFTGEAGDWSAIGGKPGKISAYTRNTASGTYKSFQKLAMSKKDYGSETQKMAGNEAIASEVAKNPNGIGYVGLAYINKPGIKVLKVNGSAPTKESVAAKKYPIARPLYYYTNGEPTGLAKDFVTFTLSDAGQKVVEKVGFVPVK